MLSRKEALIDIFSKHGLDAVYVTSTGYISRAVYNLFSKYSVFYMQGSMGIAPAIGLGIASSTDKTVVVIHGDGSHLMHLGITHTVRDLKLDNLFIYILDNGCYESVGGQVCSSIENEYIGVDKIYKISCDGKPTERVGIDFEDNVKEIMEVLKC